MKKLIIAIALLAFLAPMTPAVARDANRDALAAAEKARQIQQKKDVKNPINVGGGMVQVPGNNPDQDHPDYDAPGLWEPMGSN
ncbi:MAG: hypothetical protein AB1733_01675 [Thermodesulfobacteriota bacterium]